jgi:tetratricopeptide (TPR) repeat protein
MKLLDHCVPGLEARAEHDTLAAALYWRAFCAVGKGRLGPQRRDAERSLALARKARNRGMEAMALRLLGFALDAAGSLDEGVAACLRALTIAKELGEPMSEYLALTSAAHHAAIETLQTAMAAFAQHADRRGQALCLLKTGEAYLGLGETRLGVISLEESLPIFRELGLPEYAAHAAEALEACCGQKVRGRRAANGCGDRSADQRICWSGPR